MVRQLKALGRTRPSLSRGSQFFCSSHLLRYDSCDVGTFPNQTFKDGSGPAAALHSDFSRAKYNYELSWLPGQRLSCVKHLLIGQISGLTFDD
jgi:hypothetical protein